MKKVEYLVYSNNIDNILHNMVYITVYEVLYFI